MNRYYKMAILVLLFSSYLAGFYVGKLANEFQADIYIPGGYICSEK